MKLKQITSLLLAAVLAVSASVPFTASAETELVNAAEAYTTVLASGTGLGSTFSDAVDYNDIFPDPDNVQEVGWNSGNLMAVCGTSGSVQLVRYGSEKITTIYQDGYKFGAAATDAADNLYILWGRAVTASVYDGMDAEKIDNIVVCKYTADGAFLGRCPIPYSLTDAMVPFYCGNARLEYNNGVLGCLFSTQWSSGHQGSEFTFIDAEKMTVLDHSDWKGSHTLGLTLMKMDNGFVSLQRGDCYPRGLNMNLYIANSPSNVRFTSLWPSVVFHASGEYGESGSHQNDTHVYLGGLAGNDTVFAAAGKAERGYTSGNYAQSTVATERYDVFVKLIAQDLKEGMSGLGGENRPDAATGEVADQNVIWLTDLAENEAAGAVKVTALDDGSFCVLWERFVDRKFDSIRYAIVDKLGNTISEERKITGARLSVTSFQPVVTAEGLRWSVYDDDTNVLTWYTVDLDAYVSEADSFLLGDVDGNGTVDAADAAEILAEAARNGTGVSTFTQKQIAAADVNKDGEPEASDAAAILAYAAAIGAGRYDAVIEDFI